MADEDDSQKTEEPTGRKLSQARDKGQVANSKEVSNFVVILGLAFVVGALGPYVVGDINKTLAGIMINSWQIPINQGSVGQLLQDTVFAIILAIIPIFGLFVVLTAGANLAQVGFLFTTEPMTPKLDKLNPISGMKRLFSLKSIVEFLKSIAKLIIVGTIVLIILIPQIDDVALLMDMSLSDVMSEAQSVVLMVTIGVASAMAVIAGLDFAYQRYEHIKSLRMSKQELKDEYKQTEGDPHVKARLRQIRAERARQRMMAAVPQADVVVTNPTHFAVALQYDQDAMGAPVVVAKGADEVALRIREVANENDVPIVENPPLARALFNGVEIDQEIPEDHYKAVAKVISYVYSLKKRH